MDEDGESCWNCLQGWEWMWILYFWAKTRHDGDVFPVFQVKRQRSWDCLLEKKFSEPGVFSDEQTRVNFVVEEAINQWGDEDPVFGMDEVFFLEALASCWGGWNIHLPATNKWAESEFERCQKMSAIAIIDGQMGVNVKIESFYFDRRTEWVRMDALQIRSDWWRGERASETWTWIMSSLLLCPRYVCHTCQLCVSCMSDMCVIHVRHVCQTSVPYMCVT